MLAHVITANRLGDGAVVFFTAARGWSEELAAAEVVADAKAAEALLKVAEKQGGAASGVGAYVSEVELQDGVVVPNRLRETIRAKGPTTHPDFQRP